MGQTHLVVFSSEREQPRPPVCLGGEEVTLHNLPGAHSRKRLGRPGGYRRSVDGPLHQYSPHMQKLIKAGPISP
jgi:hypothetical protein